MKRRKFLKLLTGAGATATLGSGAISLLLPVGGAEGKSFGKKLTKFVDRLPVPHVIGPTDTSMDRRSSK